MINNYSFDVFDTLISRKWANDKGVYVVLREQLSSLTEVEFSDHFIDEFVNLRLRAQKVANETAAHPEITLDDIYAALGADFPQLRAEHLELLQKLEESIEIEHCYAIPHGVSRVMELIGSGHKVFLISDMYLSKAVVKQMLEKAAPNLCAIPLYLSSELKLRKADGTLFRYVCKDQDIQPSSLIHTGDNFDTDCVMAKRTGVGYVFYQGSHLSKIEKKLL